MSCETRTTRWTRKPILFLEEMQPIETEVQHGGSEANLSSPPPPHEN